MLLASTMVPPARAQPGAVVRVYAIGAQDLAAAIRHFALETGRDVAFDPTLVAGKRTHGVTGRRSEEDALGALLAGTGLRFRRTSSGYVLLAASARDDAHASARIARGLSSTGAAMHASLVRDTGPDIIVTAQKKAESIQSVPIAITAIMSNALDDKKVESGADLLRVVPNVNFSKTFSSMYNITIRGIGTKALNASSDPGVAVAYNNTPLIRNRLFEQEFFDLQRIEVLRGPQGTLYGRNATGGVVNLIPASPTGESEGSLKAETGNYMSRRVSGMVNLPLGDGFAIRGAGAWTKRDGYDFNDFTQNRVNGRDLWSTRFSVALRPSDGVSVGLIWEHFSENDTRARSAKALCTPDPGPTMIGHTAVPAVLQGRMSQGCLPGSLYEDAAYGVPNFAAVTPILVLQGAALGVDPNSHEIVPLLRTGNPYEGIVQSRNPRRTPTIIDPIFRAKNDIVQFNLELKLSEGLKLVSQGGHSRDRWYSSQDYNRFISNPAFNDSRGLLTNALIPFSDPGLSPNGILNDPQLGSSDRIVGIDLNRTSSRQWSQELRIQSNWSGAFNFNFGANYLDFKTRDDYYAFNNMFTAIALTTYNATLVGPEQVPPVRSFKACPVGSEGEGDQSCLYIDRGGIGKTNDQGHNYFLSRNDVRIKSYSIFGEAYFKINSNVKITGGLRYTLDRKIQSQIPSQLLLTKSIFSGGLVNYGYPALDDVNQKWGRVTGRLVVDWRPRLSFTDNALFYASFSRGYKAGGANPPRVDFNPLTVQYLPLPQIYKPEHVNAFEVGAKSVLVNGKMILNVTGFFYDYKNYQISQVSDRITYTENLPARSWGLELEGVWQPSRAFRIDTNLGYLRAWLRKGAESIDPLNRTAGNSEWQVLRPWLQAPSNCIASKALVQKILNTSSGLGALPVFKQFGLAALCPGVNGFGTFNPDKPGGPINFSQIFGFRYDPTADAPNGGRGFASDVSGNPLPNAPRLTLNVGAQYTFFSDRVGWNLTFRGDYYYQSYSMARIYNLPIDRLRGWSNLNIAATLAQAGDKLSFQFYVKNLFNNRPITDAFTTADDIGLPTNIFYGDPRLIGFNAIARF